MELQPNMTKKGKRTSATTVGMSLNKRIRTNIILLLIFIALVFWIGFLTAGPQPDEKLSPGYVNFVYSLIFITVVFGVTILIYYVNVK